MMVPAACSSQLFISEHGDYKSRKKKVCLFIYLLTYLFIRAFIDFDELGLNYLHQWELSFISLSV